MSDRPIDRVLSEVGDELSRALDKFAVFNSPHEGKAVIEEELDELWLHVKANTGRSSEARVEALQVAAMALRYVIDLCCDATVCPHGVVEGGCDCGYFNGENPSYGPGNPDWERDFDRDRAE